MEKEIGFAVECPTCYNDFDYFGLIELDFGYAEIEIECPECYEVFIHIYNEEYDHDY